MRVQSINLNLIPGGVMPVIHLSQYDQDADGSLLFLIYNGAIPFDLTGCTATIDGTKPDGTVFTYPCTVYPSYLTSATYHQMTTVAGEYQAEIRISKDTDIIGTLNFIISVEPAGISTADLSNTDIPALIDKIQKAANQAENAADTAVQASSEAETSKVASGENAEDSEAWARGTRGGVEVPSTDETYHNNSKHYSEQSATSASASSTSAKNAASSASAAATSASNAASSASASKTSADNAATSEANAKEYVSDAKNWAVGPSESGSGTDNNNAKYWAQQAQSYAKGGIIYKGSINFSAIPTSGMENGDMYDIKDEFTTDSRFIEGAGIKYGAGTDIIWNSSTSKWDVQSDKSVVSFNGRYGSVTPEAGDYSAAQIKYSSSNVDAELDKFFVISNQSLSFSTVNNAIVATISNSKVTANSSVYAMFTDATLQAAADAGVVVDSLAGQIKFTAETTPNMTLVCNIIVKNP